MAITILIDAAEMWLQRTDAEPTDVIVLDIFPAAAIGVLRADGTCVRSQIDAAAAELLEAAAPVVQAGLEQLSAGARKALEQALAGGATLRALVSVHDGSVQLEAAYGAERVALASAWLVGDLH